jgi:cytochrome c
MRKFAFLLAVVLAVLCGPLLAGEPNELGIGRVAKPAEIAARATSVTPDGKGLPSGRGNAVTGRAIYMAKCAACHGAKGEGNDDFPQLVGGQGTLATAKPIQTIGSFWPHATTVWDYINRAMPYQDAGTLKPDEVYAVTAYLLHKNGIVGEHTELNRISLPTIKMPNRDGFVPDPRPDITMRR